MLNQPLLNQPRLFPGRLDFLAINIPVNRFLLALKDTPENNPVEDEVAQKQKVAEINSELQDKKEPGSCLVPLAEKSSESKPRRGIRRQQLPSRQKLAANAVLSPLTLFLLGAESTPTYDPVYEKLLRKKRSRWRNRTLNRARKPRAFSK